MLSHHSSRLRVAAAVFLIAFFALFQFLPLYTVLVNGLRPAFLVEVAREPIYVQGLINSFAVAVCVTALVMLIAIPLAVMSDRFEFPGKTAVNALVLLPLILPPFVGAIGFQQIFGKLGMLNAVLATVGFVERGGGPDWLGGGRFWIVCLIEALHLFPILYLNIVTALANLDPQWDEAARNLGCGAWTRFRRITLPLIRPGLFAGGVIVFIWSFTELGTPLMMGYLRVTAVQIFDGINQLESNPLAYSLVVVLLAFSAGFYLIGRNVFGRGAAAASAKGVSARRAMRLTTWRRWLPLAAFGLVIGLAALPHLGIVLMSVSRDWYNTVLPNAYTIAHYDEALSHPFVVPSIVNSLRYSSMAMCLCVVVGILVALAVVRWRLPGHQILDVLAMMPLAVPGIIFAFGYLSMATRYDALRAILDPTRNPTALLIIAYAMRRLPYVVRAAAAGLQQAPEELELAARNLGAGPVLTLRRITVPLIAANLIAGALFAFSFAMLEVSDSLILAQKARHYPITRAIYELSGVLGSGPWIGCAFGVWAMCFLGATMWVATRLLGQKTGAMFRF